MEDLPNRPATNRPVSRRGERPGTSFRTASARPPSAVPTGTASRLTNGTTTTTSHSTTPSSVHSSATGGRRIGTVLDFAGTMMTDRPITQQGLSGLQPTTGTVRLGTGIGIRQIKDKRYWQSQLQFKINEIVKETERLMGETQLMERGKSAQKTAERKVKEAAETLTIYQNQLTDMNIALDSYNSGLTRQQLQQEATVIRDQNERIQTDLEDIFQQRQSHEQQNRSMEESVKSERNKIDLMIESLSTEEQSRYRNLQKMADSLRMNNLEIHSEMDEIDKRKQQLESTIQSSQIRSEAVRLLMKLSELTKKRNQLRDDEANRLSPGQEREKLLSEVRANNQTLQTVNRQMKQIDEELISKREQMQQLEQDLEEGMSERHTKYRELKRRDETMSEFLDEFPKSMELERKNIDDLKNQITYAIEQITLQGINLKSYELSKPLGVFDEKNDLGSHDGLIKEYKRLSIQLKQLQLLEKRIKEQSISLKEEEQKAVDDIATFSDLENLRTEAGVKMEKLTSDLEELKSKKRATEGVLNESIQRNQELKASLRQNETFRKISHLEERLTDLMRDNKQLQESIDLLKSEYDYQELKQEAERKVNQIMEFLRTDNENVFSIGR